MPKVNVYNQEGKSVGELELSATHFGVKTNPALVHEAVVAARANARKSIASTKTRGEVRGGGKKPWKQKGTGRARQGSIRSPQWVGGGITFGPRAEREFSLKMNKKAKRAALFMVLSDKVVNQKLVVLDSINTELAKTKAAALVMKKLPVERTVLLVSAGSNPSLMRMVRNLPNVTLVSAGSVNLLDVLSHRSIVFLKDAVAAFDKKYVIA